ncbi:MAG: thioredoxin fold domain-containing protein [Planctomycetes bacterium]|nr:thioredoxin fold domain-containing protein [Planctomycetota bacterium]
MLTTALTLALLIGNPWDDQGPAWHTDYPAAMSQVRQADKPLFVLFCARASQESYLKPEGEFLGAEVEHLLKTDYVSVIIDTDTRAGAAQAAQFGVAIVPYCAIIDRSGKWQMFYQAGYPAAHKILNVLEQNRRTKLGADRKPIRDVARTASQDRPAARRGTAARGTVQLASAQQSWVIDVGEADFETEVIERSKERPVVVDFAADWCGPCRRLGPTLEKLAHERSGGFVLARVNVDRAPGLSARYRVESLPTVKVFYAGSPVNEFVGLMSESQLRPLIDRICSLVSHDPAVQLSQAESADETPGQ